jgi:hypothetical protein
VFRNEYHQNKAEGLGQFAVKEMQEVGEEYKQENFGPTENRFQQGLLIREYRVKVCKHCNV